MNLEIKTPRLSLRPFTWNDLAFLVRLHADERVAPFLAAGRPRTESETREWLTKTLAWQEQERLGHLGVWRKDTNELIGRCGLTCMELEEAVPHPRAFLGRGSTPNDVRSVPAIEVGYTFMPAVWGRGYATEAARRMRDDAFGDRQQPRVISLIREDNVPSIRVAEKNGMVRRGAFIFCGRPFLHYEITRDEWQTL